MSQLLQNELRSSLYPTVYTWKV